MPIRFYNTLTHRLEPFEPIAPPDVYMYNCGPTVYDFAHIGNFRAFVFADVLRRFLELVGYRVHQVMNLTDVGHMTEDAVADGAGEDKMQVAARRLKEAKKRGTLPPGAIDNPDDPYQIAEFYIGAFLEDARKLGLKIADDQPTRKSDRLGLEVPVNMPRATEHVGKMMKIILKLVENGHAYVGRDGAVYYRVESFPEYGRLSGNTLDKLRGLRVGAGGRVHDEHQAVKRHPADFLLWKPDPTHIMKWDSPWGVGYPGWHIECSAMAMELTGRETIDLHTGGEDNIFPHHECEIAQSRGATGRDRFATTWMHTRFLLVEGEKMSKSKGNFYTVRDVAEGKATGRPVDPAVLRFELLKAHYRSNMNFTAKSLVDSGQAVQKLRDADRQAAAALKGKAPNAATLESPVVREFAGFLADDLNVSGALGYLFAWLGRNEGTAEERFAILRAVNSVVGFAEPLQVIALPFEDETIEKTRAIDAARARKDFTTADHLRKELQEAGYEVMNSKVGTTARKKLA